MISRAVSPLPPPSWSSLPFRQWARSSNSYLILVRQHDGTDQPIVSSGTPNITAMIVTSRREARPVGTRAAALRLFSTAHSPSTMAPKARRSIRRRRAGSHRLASQRNQHGRRRCGCRRQRAGAAGVPMATVRRDPTKRSRGLQYDRTIPRTSCVRKVGSAHEPASPTRSLLNGGIPSIATAASRFNCWQVPAARTNFGQLLYDSRVHL